MQRKAMSLGAYARSGRTSLTNQRGQRILSPFRLLVHLQEVRMIPQSAIQKFRESLRGSSFCAGVPGYDAARTVPNAQISHLSSSATCSKAMPRASRGARGGTSWIGPFMFGLRSKLLIPPVLNRLRRLARSRLELGA